ncbi:MAG: hypothetical protein AAF998_09535 [Bacteroidota bacterium]
MRLLGLLVLALFLLEILYRYQVVDTYRREWKHLNPRIAAGKEIASGGVLVLGDSFTAAPENWVDRLRRRHPELPIWNAAVPGTGIRQANFLAPRRLAATQPQQFIYQIYVGNDLFDLRFPLNWEDIGGWRNLYWGLANRFRGLGWLNYALGQFRAAPPPSGTTDGKNLRRPFAPNRYSPRARLYLKAEPGLIENSVLVNGKRAADFEEYLGFLDELVRRAEDEAAAIYLLVIPHCAQVHARYTASMRQLGAEITDEKALRAASYPFLRRIEDHFAGQPQVQIVNALPVLRDLEACGTAAYFTNDIHLSPAGQQAVADLMDEQLGER